MSHGQKRKTPEEGPNEAEDQLQFYRHRAHLLRLTISKFSSLCDDFHKFALLRSTILRFQETRKQEKAAQRMLQSAPPSQQTSKEDLPESYTTGDTESLAETGKEPLHTPDAWETPTFGMDTASTSSGQPGGQGGHGSSLVEPFPSALEETSCSRGEPPLDPSQGPHLGPEEPASPNADTLFGSSSEDPSPSAQDDTSILDSLSQEELFGSTLFGSFEILAANYLSDITSDDLFSDIDISEFETTPAPPPSRGLTAPDDVEQDLYRNPQAEAPHLPTQDANEINDLEHSME